MGVVKLKWWGSGAMKKPFIFVRILIVSLSFEWASAFLPIDESDQGNKARIAYSLAKEVKDLGACSERVHSWQTWNGGMNGRLIVHLKEEHTMETWSAFLVLDTDVTDFNSYDGEVNTKTGKSFKITPKGWNAEVKEGQRRMIGFTFKWPQDTKTPKLVALTVNGIPYTCVEGGTPVVEVTSKPNEDQQSNVPSSSKPISNDDNDEEIALLPENTRSERGVFVSWPKKVMGLYVLLADDDHDGYESDAVWEPRLYEWQQKAANVLFFTFIHPITMDVPPAFEALAKTRAKDIPGAIPKDTVILFALGGYAYSSKIKPWPWLESKAAAEKMAERVAEWPERYGIDGIDLDLEDGAGDTPKAGPMMIHFVKKLRQLQPKMIIGQPTYGFPQVKAEIAVINASWKNKRSTGVADSVGLMVYQGTQALNYVKNYADASKQWSGFPIKTDVPKNCILLGAKGATGAGTIRTLAAETMKNDYLGIMVWYASVKGGLQYAVSWDASESEATIEAYIEVGQKFRQMK